MEIEAEAMNHRQDCLRRHDPDMKTQTPSGKQENERREHSVRVSAGRCLMMKREAATSCHECVKGCPEEAIDLRSRVRLDRSRCNSCGICIEVCPSGVFAFPEPEDDTRLSRRDFFSRCFIRARDGKPGS